MVSRKEYLNICQQIVESERSLVEVVPMQQN